MFKKQIPTAVRIPIIVLLAGGVIGVIFFLHDTKEEIIVKENGGIIDEEIKSLEDYIESIDRKKLSLGETIEKRPIYEVEDVFHDKFVINTNFEKNFISPYWEQIHQYDNYKSTLNVLEYFFKEIAIENLVNGDYSEKDIQNIFEDQGGQIASGYSHDEDIFEFRNFKISTGNFDNKNKGEVAIIEFTRSLRSSSHSVNLYILIVNSEGEKKLLIEMMGHKINGRINIIPVNIGGNWFFEVKRSGYGGTCVGETTEGTICELKNMEFFCYDKPLYEYYLSMGPGCGSQKNVRKEYKTKDVDKDGKNELVITFTAVYETDLEEQLKKIMEEVYKLDKNGDLVLISQEVF